MTEYMDATTEAIRRMMRDMRFEWVKAGLPTNDDEIKQWLEKRASS
jgi:hypothetical protein